MILVCKTLVSKTLLHFHFHFYFIEDMQYAVGLNLSYLCWHIIHQIWVLGPRMLQTSLNFVFTMQWELNCAFCSCRSLSWWSTVGILVGGILVWYSVVIADVLHHLVLKTECDCDVVRQVEAVRRIKGDECRYEVDRIEEECVSYQHIHCNSQFWMNLHFRQFFHLPVVVENLWYKLYQFLWASALSVIRPTVPLHWREEQVN